MTANKTLKIALVGCGGLGSRHAKNADGMEGVEVVAVCDVDRGGAERLAGELTSRPAAYTDHREMLEAHGPDGVLVVTPNFTHSEITVDVASSGAHVFCEKPMALTVEDCDAMIDAANSAEVFLMIGYVRRFQASYKEMKRLIDAGEIGQVQMAHTVRLGSGPPGGAEGWQLSREKYGGLFSMHSHELDQLTWMAGEIDAVQVVMKYGDNPENTVEESIFINLEFASGAVGSLSSSRVYPVGSYELGVAGTEGSVKITSGGSGSLALNRLGQKAIRIDLDRNNAAVDELAFFFGCIRKGEPPSPDGTDGRRTIAISLAAHESARTGGRIEVQSMSRI